MSWETFDQQGWEKYVRDDRGVAFVFDGGQYVNVYWQDHLQLNGLVDAVPFTVINVKDMDGTLRVTDRTRLIAECDLWLEQSGDDLAGYLEQWAL